MEALSGATIWGCAKRVPCSGVSDLGPKSSGLGSNLRYKRGYERVRKWECCCFRGSLAQRAITPVEDEKPGLSMADNPSPLQMSETSEALGFKDLSLLPSKSFSVKLQNVLLLEYGFL